MSSNAIPPGPLVFASYGQAWRNMWPHFGILLGMAALSLLLQMPSQIGQWLPQDMWPLATVLGGFSLLLGVLVGGPLTIGIVAANLKVSRGEHPAWSDLGLGFSRYGQAVLLGILSVLIVMAGFILFILPGIYLAVRLAFASQRFADDGMDAVGALKASFADVKGHWWRTFGLGLMAVPIVIAGLLMLGVGVFGSAVWINQANVVYWRALRAAAVA